MSIELMRIQGYFIITNISIIALQKNVLSPDKIYESIGKLEIVNITLERDRDNPQQIFESLNSTGMDLSQSDLIRNYVLMGLDPVIQIEFIFSIGTL